MTRNPTSARALVGVTALLTAIAGCTFTVSNPGAVDGDAMIPDAQSDVSLGESGPNACRVKLLRASDYDQSCIVDTDCVYITEGNVCDPCLFAGCSAGAVNVRAIAQYNSDLANTPAGAAELNGQTCTSGCDGTPFLPCCVKGKCQKSTTSQCPAAAADAGDAGADARPDPCADACTQGEQCVQLQGTMRNVCAGAHCGTSTVDGSTCPAGQMCRTVTYDPCPPPPPGQARCNIASVTYDACVSGVADASPE
jgi:hypothetical protein